MNKYAALSSPQATLDLHEHTKTEALQACRHFIHECYQKGLQRILIITGKGIHSADNKSILKPAIEAALNSMEEVQSFTEARRDRGGEGALEVILESNTSTQKRSRNTKK